MHNLQLMTTSFVGRDADTTQIELVVLDLTGEDLNNIADANGMAKSLMDLFSTQHSSINLGAFKVRVYVDVPENVISCLGNGNATVAHAWVESRESMSHQRLGFTHVLTIDALIDGNMGLSITEEPNHLVESSSSLKLRELQDILFWKTHEVGDNISTLSGDWVGVVTRAEQEVEELKEFVVPVVRTSYSKQKDIAVMAKSLAEAQAKALEEAGNHDYRENTAEYELA